MEILVAGDYCPIERVNSLIKNNDYHHLFEKIESVISKADYSIVNFEYPIICDESKPIKKCGPNLGGSQASIKAIKEVGFNVCTLANNHILDQGEESCLKTKIHLEEAGLKTIGVGRDLESSTIPLILVSDMTKVAVINCCEHEFSIAGIKSAGANPLNPIQQYRQITKAKKEADFVLVIVHGGHEHCQYPSPRMKETYRFFVEAGADCVVNHHQHCFCGYEIYNEKPIFYGLGNFCFDRISKRNSIWNYGFMVSLNFQKEKPVRFELHPYEQCNEKPTVEPLKDEVLKKFNDEITAINEIINDDERLLSEWSKWIVKNNTYMLMDFQPYSSRITKALFVRGLLPSFIRGNKKYEILNHIGCESHYDSLKLLLENI